jgi:hypothetical protein
MTLQLLPTEFPYTRKIFFSFLSVYAADQQHRQDSICYTERRRTKREGRLVAIYPGGGEYRNNSNDGAIKVFLSIYCSSTSDAFPVLKKTFTYRMA